MSVLSSDLRSVRNAHPDLEALVSKSNKLSSHSVSTIFVLHPIETSSLRDTVNLSLVALPHARFDACNQSNAMKLFRSGTMPIWRMLSHAPPLVVDGVWLKLVNYLITHRADQSIRASL